MEPFIHVLELPFVICKVCKFGCVANEIPKHLKQKHTKIAADQIDEIIKAVDAIDDTGSPSSSESDSDSKNSEDDQKEFEESERDHSLDDWMSETASQDAPNVSLFHQDPGHKFENETAAKSSEEFLELLFELNLSLSIEAFVDGQPGSSLLVYFSGVLGFSSDRRRF
ncbi:hypothetical protein FMUND_12724 [Fusarium mundagurra]|uniref:Uncharacterized protein n=1 Tax=Fusarium mundagurra TaxID=1567541 RepID=A0A8H5Y1F9_9HYPO|nr:hypothetical protein FMUND_12724 [Fusarium mundagurra]